MIMRNRLGRWRINWILIIRRKNVNPLSC